CSCRSTLVSILLRSSLVQPLPPPPTSPLFPYTTLFRSERPPCQQRVRRSVAQLVLQALGEGEDRLDLLGGEIGDTQEVELRDGTGRKSTRLNSSHVAISYAVFCLKKKKKKTGP